MALSGFAKSWVGGLPAIANASHPPCAVYRGHRILLLLTVFLCVFHRPYFELKAKYYVQLEVGVAFSGFVVDGIFLPSKSHFCGSRAFKWRICHKRRVGRDMSLTERSVLEMVFVRSSGSGL